MARSLMKNSWDKSESPHTGPISSWAGFTGPLGEKGTSDGQIDHILVTDDIRVLRSATVNDYPQGLRPSDHHSICCEAEL